MAGQIHQTIESAKGHEVTAALQSLQTVEGQLTSLKAYAHRADASKESEIDQLIMTARSARAAVVRNQPVSDAEIVSERTIERPAASDRVVDLTTADQANPSETMSAGIAPLLAAPVSQDSRSVDQAQTISETVHASEAAASAPLSLTASQDTTGEATQIQAPTSRNAGRRSRRNLTEGQNNGAEEQTVGSNNPANVDPAAGDTEGTSVESLIAVQKEVGEQDSAKAHTIQAGATRFNIFESYLAPLQNGNRAQRALYWAMGGLVMPVVEETVFRFAAFAEAGQALFGGAGFNLASVAGDTVLFGALFAGLHSVVEMSVIARQSGGGIKGWRSALTDRSVWSNFGQRLVFSGAMTAVYLASAAVFGPVAALGVSALAHGLFNFSAMTHGETPSGLNTGRSWGRTVAASLALFFASNTSALANVTSPDGEVASVVRLDANGRVMDVAPLRRATNAPHYTTVSPGDIPAGSIAAHSHPETGSTWPSITDLFQKVNGVMQGIILSADGRWTQYHLILDGGDGDDKTRGALNATPVISADRTSPANGLSVDAAVERGSRAGLSLAFVQLIDGRVGSAATAETLIPVERYVANAVLNGEPMPANAEHTPFFDKVLSSLQRGVNSLEEDLAANRLTLEELRRQVDQSQRAVQGNPMLQLHTARAFLEKSPLAPSAAYAALAKDTERLSALRALNVDSVELVTNANDLKAKAAKLKAALNQAAAERMLARLVNEANGRAVDLNLLGKHAEFTEATLTDLGNKVFQPLFARTLGLPANTVLPELSVTWSPTPSKANAARAWMVSRWANNSVRNEVEIRGTDQLSITLALLHESAHAVLMAAWGRPMSQERLDMEALAGALTGLALESRAVLQPLAQFEESESRSFAGHNRPELWRAREIAHGLLAKALALGAAKGREVRATLAAAQQDGGLLAMALGVGLGKTSTKATEPLLFMVSASDLIARGKLLEDAVKNLEALAQQLSDTSETKEYRAVVVNNLGQRLGDWKKITARLKGKGVLTIDKAPAGAVQDRTNKVVLARLMPALPGLLGLSRSAKLRIAILTGAQESWIADKDQVLFFMKLTISEFVDKAFEAMKAAGRSA
ncbi:MAG: hypothetical protein IPP68_03760 [Elusimicrobia bacterium]|nr:hypothetical protein [Elusimicrobiota bacterium]